MGSLSPPDVHMIVQLRLRPCQTPLAQEGAETRPPPRVMGSSVRRQQPMCLESSSTAS